MFSSPPWASGLFRVQKIYPTYPLVSLSFIKDWMSSFFAYGGTFSPIRSPISPLLLISIGIGGVSIHTWFCIRGRERSAALPHSFRRLLPFFPFRAGHAVKRFLLSFLGAPCPACFFYFWYFCFLSCNACLFSYFRGQPPDSILPSPLPPILF